MKKLVLKAIVLSFTFFVVQISSSQVLAEPLFTLPSDVDLQYPLCDFDCHDNRPGGSDFPIPVGTNVQVSLGGTIHLFDNGLPNTGGTTGGYGNYAKIDHGVINGHHWETTYGHMTTGTFIVDDGGYVYRGQIFGKSGNSGWSTGPHLHFEVRKDGIPVDPYSDTDWLWTTNPPSHGYFNRANYDFSDGNAQGWETANSTTTDPPGLPASPETGKWFVYSTGSDPQVVSPEYNGFIPVKHAVIKFYAKVECASCSANTAKMFIKDVSGNWYQAFATVSGTFADQAYNEYTAEGFTKTTDGSVPDNNATIKQIRIDLTADAGTNEVWYFDWIKIYSDGSSWDYKDSLLGWTIKQNGQTADFFPPDNEDFWRINPIGKQVQIVSPENLIISDLAEKIGIRYSVQTNGNEIIRVYFDTGSGFSQSCYSGKQVTHDTASQTVILDIPSCVVVGNIERVMFDVLDNDAYQGKLIAINNIAFLADDDHATAEMPSYSNFLSDSDGSGGGTGDYAFVGSTICETVENNAPVGKNYSFTPADGYVGYFFELAYIYDSLSLDVKWFKPDGSLLGACNNITDWPTNVYWGGYKKSRFMDISGQVDYGTWRAELWINGSKINTQYFSLSADGGGSSGPAPDPDSDGDGTPDSLDGCPSDPNKSTAGVCGCGMLDIDSDGDGTMDCEDSCPDDINKTSPGQCGCGVSDTDSDNDGTPDCIDSCPDDPNKVESGICGCGDADNDSDGDGVYDCQDDCPSDPNKTVSGICGCGTPDIDSDSDGVYDCNDSCPNDPNKSAPGVCGCGITDTDSDGDGTMYCEDDCPSDPEKTSPGQCGCGVADIDTDGDGIADCIDEYPNDPNNGSGGLGEPSIAAMEVTGQFEVTLGWAAISGATAYQIHRYDTVDGEIIFETSNLSFVDGPLDPSRSYYYQVQAINDTDVSPISSPRCACTTTEETTICICSPKNLRIILN